MNRPIRDDWCKALRSKKYKQGKGVLRSVDNTWCCIGVLCDIVAPIRWTPPDDLENEYGDHHYFYDGQFEIPDKDDFITKQSQLSVEIMTSLASKNDRYWTFEDIADWLETYV